MSERQNHADVQELGGDVAESNAPVAPELGESRPSVAAQHFSHAVGRFRSIRRRLFDKDYSPAFQDEYQRLWHEAADERDKLKRQLGRLGWRRYMVGDDD